MDYVISASNLRAAVYGIKQNKNVEEMKKVISAMVIPEFQTKSGVKIGELSGNLAITQPGCLFRYKKNQKIHDASVLRQRMLSDGSISAALSLDSIAPKKHRCGVELLTKQCPI